MQKLINVQVCLFVPKMLKNSSLWNQKLTAPTIAEQKIRQTVCRFKNFVHLCKANIVNRVIHAKIVSNNKKAAYGCKSRDFSTSVDCVCSDRLLFI